MFRSARASNRGWAPSTAFLTNPTFFAMPWATSKGGRRLVLVVGGRGRGRGGSAISTSALAMLQARRAALARCAVLARGVRRVRGPRESKGADSLRSVERGRASQAIDGLRA